MLPQFRVFEFYGILNTACYAGRVSIRGAKIVVTSGHVERYSFRIYRAEGAGVRTALTNDVAHVIPPHNPVFLALECIETASGYAAWLLTAAAH